MMDVKDVRGLRVARAELSKRGIDAIRADLRVTQGVLYIRGTICPMGSSQVGDIRQEMQGAVDALRTRPEIRDIDVDCEFAGGAKEPALSGASVI